MNSFLFNTLLIMLCAIPVNQFVTSAFSLYARLTTLDRTSTTPRPTH